MNLRDAKVCLDCDEVFTGVTCPKCAACSWCWLSHWVKPVVPDDRPLLVGSLGPDDCVEM